jgi:hypothetical protein
VAGSQRRALGALFLVLAVFFAGVSFTAFAADERGVWVIGIAAAALALWLASLAAKGFRRRAR